MAYCAVEELRGVRGRTHNNRRQKERAKRLGDIFAGAFGVLVSQGTCQWKAKELAYHIVHIKGSKDQEMGGGRNEGGRC